jgi:hypothetical protein
MPEIDATAILQITDKDYQLLEVEGDAAAYRVFQYLLAVWNFQKDHSGPVGVAI